MKLIDSDDEGVSFEEPKMETHVLNTALSFENVVFYYPTRPDVTVLKSVSFQLNAGEKLALVGQSGSGKSTIAALILRFFDPKEGQIKWGNQLATDLDKSFIRSQMAFVPQEVILFGGTIRENILYGKPHADEETLNQVVKDANVLEFITQFPEGLDTLVGERGVQLSGGQRQRIAIARAMIRNPKILILDEATSALDTSSERQVQEALDRLMKGRTSIVIAHRLSTVKDCDQVLVLEKGEVKEMGHPSQLLQDPNSLYGKMLNMQHLLNH
jgi:ABC-type multidrug transport system fused ATPase/permease subunit